MGKSFIIPDADFSENGIYIRDYLIATEEEIQNAATNISLTACGYAYADQNAIRGLPLRGVRMNIATAGTMRIFKATATSLSEVTTTSQLTEVATITTSQTGVQDIDFSTPITLGQNEWLVFGNPDSETYDTLKHLYLYLSSDSAYANVGKPSVVLASHFWPAVAFYC